MHPTLETADTENLKYTVRANVIHYMFFWHTVQFLRALDIFPPGNTHFGSLSAPVKN